MNCEIRITRLIGLARRAGKVCYGKEGVEDAILKKKAKLVVFACDISEKTKSGLENILNGIPSLNLNLTKEELGHCIGSKPTGVIAVTDSNFKKGILEVK